MIELCRAKERHYDQCGSCEVWLTFFPPDRADPIAGGFGSLEGFDEIRLSPGGGVPSRRRRDADLVTYVREGALTCEDSTGRSGIVLAGEFQRLSGGCGIRHRETNASRTHCGHVFQIWLRPSEAELEPSHEEKRFSVAERRGLLRVVASPDARRGSLRIHQDGLMFSALLDPGQHLVHELSPARSAWLHLVYGEATLGDAVLTAGDGAGVTAERAVSLTARDETEILLLDIGER